MKKIYLFLLLLIFFIPFNVFGETDSISLDVTDTGASFDTGNLEFHNFKFIDNTKNSSLSFGVTAKIINKNDNEKKYETEIYFYDKDSNEIAHSKVSHVAIAGEGIFNHFLNASELHGNKISDIKYYLLSINSNVKETSNISIPSKNPLYVNNDYVIDKYDVNMIVNSNNTIDITETITAYFNVSKHGIIRKIPTLNNVTRLDGTTNTILAKIKNLNVNDNYTTSRNGNYYSIKIGNANKYITGEKQYVIKYTYDLGKDKNKNYDELYFNIIGDSWDTVIGNVTFNITMPKEFDSTKLGFSKGITGSTDNKGILYSIKNNVISGSYNGILGKNEGITVRCELDDGYFVQEKKSLLSYIILFIPEIALILSLLIYYYCKNKDVIVDTVEFFPPDDYNSLEIGYLYKGKANDNDVVSLLIYLANKGYIKIEETEEKFLFTYKIIKIYRMKNIYEGDNELERKFFDYLFIRGKEVDYNGKKTLMVTSYQLRYSFYKSIDKILNIINSKENNKKILKSAFLVKFLLTIFLIAAIIGTFAVPIYQIIGIFPFESLLILVFYIPFFVSAIYAKGMPIVFRIFVLLFITVHFLFMTSGFGLISIISENIEIIFYLILGIISITVIGYLLINIKIRTDYGNKMYGRIKGFKNFLKTTEKEKLEAMVEKYPTYFYDILPYTYVLGISKKWIKKFETIAVPEPTWYDSSTPFNINSFSSSFNRTMSTLSNSMTSSPSESGGGSSSGGSSSSGSSGGGSSGGGSGGGGGSSW